ncbi:hypothetical protein LguiB_020545 [Lonicera macranthoides]
MSSVPVLGETLVLETFLMLSMNELLRKNGAVFLVESTDSEDLVSYNPERRQVKKLHICGSVGSFYINTYKDSLASSGFLGSKELGTVLVRISLIVEAKSDSEAESSSSPNSDSDSKFSSLRGLEFGIHSVVVWIWTNPSVVVWIWTGFFVFRRGIRISINVDDDNDDCSSSDEAKEEGIAFIRVLRFS